MLKKILIVLFGIILYSSVFASISLFPNEIMYQNRPSAGIGYTEHAFELYINTRFPVDTLFKYQVHDPVLAGLMQTESSFIVHAISDSNALGVFQMKPFIASEIGALNPFNPYNDKKVAALLDEYTSIFGNVDYALGAYRVGYYGVKSMIDSGSNPMSDQRINDYVKKIRSFQRLYKEGDKITLRDYLWFEVGLNLSDENTFNAHFVIPEYIFGSFALGINNEKDFSLTFFQDFSFFWFLNTYVGYDEGVVVGLTLKSNDWYDKVTVKYEFSKNDLIWAVSSSFNFFTFDFGVSKSSLFIKPGLAINDRYFVELPVYYRDHVLVPGISAMIKF